MYGSAVKFVTFWFRAVLCRIVKRKVIQCKSTLDSSVQFSAVFLVQFSAW